MYPLISTQHIPAVPALLLALLSLFPGTRGLYCWLPGDGRKAGGWGWAHQWGEVAGGDPTSQGVMGGWAFWFTETEIRLAGPGRKGNSESGHESMLCEEVRVGRSTRKKLKVGVSGN